ncbi:outer membrane protein assembly factor BamB family protein [Streptomyces scopuliridis]|uniref:outer membrane protein assembly factor BamB family protein n=1 Tax=Streptomyces scopuliridis TaxID=452529 RepID=UPI0035DB65E6
MSQPPSQQPPQGGFGAPQDQPHGGPPGQGGPQGPQAGPQSPQGGPQSPPPPAQPPQMPPPPQTPPGPPGAQPGYGYPQAGPAGQQQPGPYNQPGPYGQQPGPYNQPGPYGQQQPGPYNQPGPYGQQPGPYGGGYPPQQFPGPPTAPPGGGGGKNPFKGKPGVIVAAAVAGALVIGGGVWLAVGGDGSGDKPDVSKSEDVTKPSGSSTADQGDDSGTGREAADDLNAGRKDGEARIEWLQINDVDLPRNGADAYGPWFAGDTVVKAMYRQVVGYSAADGKKKWTLSLPTEICAAPVASSATGKLVLGIKNGTTEKADCNQLQLVDLTTGKTGWKKEIPETGAFDLLSDITVAISGDTVTAARTGAVNAFRMSDGKELFGKLPGNCQPYALTGGPKMIAAESCSGGGNQIQELDPATGRAKWTYKLAADWDTDKVYSVNPLVISLKNDEKDTWSIVALNANGTPRSQIQGGNDKFAPKCGGGFIVFGQNLEGCVGVAADADTFYMATAADNNGTSRTNEIVAFSLDTGKSTWRAKAPEGRTMTPLRMEGGKVLVYLDPTYDMGGAVATVAPSGGAPTTLLQHPASTAQIESSFYSPKYAYVDGRFYVMSGRVSASNDEDELKTETMMAFGK